MDKISENPLTDKALFTYIILILKKHSKKNDYLTTSEIQKYLEDEYKYSIKEQKIKDLIISCYLSDLNLDYFIDNSVCKNKINSENTYLSIYKKNIENNKESKNVYEEVNIEELKKNTSELYFYVSKKNLDQTHQLQVVNLTYITYFIS